MRLGTAMNSITYVTGDATAPIGHGQRVICHVCNDVGGWGRGFVLALSKRWPEPEADFRAWFEQGDTGGFGLGAIRIVPVAPELSVANMVAQHGTRSKGGVPPIRYDALTRCLAALADHARAVGASVHMPRIGCGLAGGSWSEVAAIIDSTLIAAQVPVYVYDL